MYAQLLIDLFKYLAPFLRNVELAKPMQILYKVNDLVLQEAEQTNWREGRGGVELKKTALNGGLAADSSSPPVS